MEHTVSSLDSHAQSDVLLGLLKQITEAAAEEAQPGEQIVQPELSQTAQSDSQVSAVVGPTTAELESINELIKFDHIYYKAPNGADKDSVKSQEVEPKNVTVSVTVAAQPITEVPQQVATPPASTTTNQNKEVIDLTQSQLDLPVDINDLLDISSDSWNQLMDIDALLQGELNSTTEVTAATVTNTPAATTNISSGVSLISKDKSIVKNSKQNKLSSSRKRKAAEPITMETNSVIANDQLLTPDSLLNFDTDLSAQKSPFSESGYSSDIGSPQSDISSALSEDLWEESFTQLFPSLV